MPIHFYCPLGHRLVVPDERAGKKGRCPECQQRVFVPVPNPAPSSSAKAPSPLGKLKSRDSMIEDIVAGLLNEDDDIELSKD